MKVNLLQVQKLGWNPGKFWRLIEKIAIFSMLLLSAQTINAADLTGVYPVTNKILMIEYNEGHVDYSVFGNESANVAYYSALNISNAVNTSNYSIGSTDDTNYGSSRQPISIGRKSKSFEFNRTGGTPAYILRHFIYIELPNAMQRGKTYTVTLNNLADNRNQFSFVYEEKDLWSPTVHVNQVGFVSSGVKYAYLSQWMGTFNNTTHPNGALNLSNFSTAQFRLVRVSDNQVVFSGSITKQADKGTSELTNGNFSTTPNSTKADVWQCNFSTYTTPGIYKVAVDGIGSSYPFEIGADVYREPFNRVMKAIFAQRQGVDKELEGGQVYPRGHTNVKYVGTTTPVNVYGYYYDAGDWDGHNRHIGIPLDLMLLYDLKPNNFRDGDVSNRFRLNSSSSWVNEGTDALPDILNEARWLLDFYKRAKNAFIAIGRGTGGVPGGRLPNEEGLIGPDAGAENRASWTDTRDVHINAEQTENTYNYAAAAAYYAICLQKFYGVSSNTEITSWRNEATSAFSWADARSDDESSDGAKRSKMLASAVLYRLTGTSSYQNDYKRLLSLDTTYPGHDLWQNPHPWQYAAMIYGLTPDGHPNLDVTHRTNMRNAIITKANNDEADGESRGMRMSFPKGRMGSNGAFSTPRVYFCAFAHAVTNDGKYLRTIQNTTSYTLGGNHDNMTYVAQLGHNPDNMTFHPDSWRLLDYNSKVYKATSLPGYVNYWGMQNCDFFGCGWNWTVDEDFSRSAAFPGIDNWPAGEWRMNNKYSIAGSEFTMNESLGPAAFAYGYLTAANPSQPFTSNPRPVVTLNLNENQNFRREGCDLTVTASADTWKVKYYYDWHYIGESTDKANNFKFFWASPLANGTNTKITAVAIDVKGLISNPSPAGEKNVTITTGASCTTTPPVAVTGVTVSPTSASIAVGATQQLTSTVAPSNATNKNVTWSTSNSEVATVSSSGLVTGVTAGTATITVTTQDGAKTATSAITVTAPTSYSLNISATNGSVAKNPNKTTYSSGESVTLTATANTGYTFSSWSGDASGSTNPLTITMNANKNITANFVQSTSQCNLFQAETGYTGSSVAVATNQSGYTGSGFLDYGGQGSYAEWTVSVTSAGSYTIKFRHANGSGGNRQSELRANGSVVGNVAFAATGSWTTWAVEQIPVTLNAGNNVIRLTANTSAGGTNLDNFEVCGGGTVQTYTLSITAANGSVTKNPNKSSYTSGETVTLTATANSGYTFSSWSGSVSGSSNPITITMNSNKSITANFTQVPVSNCLLSNPSFESSLQSWTINSGTIAISTDATAGTNSARLYGGNAGMEQTYTANVAQGTTITLSFDAKYSGTGWAGVGLDFKAADGTDIQKPNLQITNTSWQSKTIVATAPAGTAKLNVWAYSGSGDLLVDNFCISGLQGGSTMRVAFSDEVEHSNQNAPLYSIYPNPLVNGELSITLLNDDAQQGERVNMSIIDTMGRVFYSNNLESQDYIHHKIDCSRFPKGVYFIKIDSKELKKTTKLIIE